MKITSLQNDLVKYWVNLKNKKFRDQEKRFLIEGDHLINEAKKYDLIEYTISCTDESANYFVTKAIMDKISDQKTSPSSIAVISFLGSLPISGNCLVLDNIQDPGNLGTIIRSAVAFNFKDIILSDTSVDLYNPKVIRATEGMIFKVNVIRKNLKEYLPILKSKGYFVAATHVEKGIDLKNIPKERVAIIIGNEGSGVSKEVLNLSDELVNINISSECESLNAGVAASIVMYEVNNG